MLGQQWGQGDTLGTSQSRTFSFADIHPDITNYVLVYQGTIGTNGDGGALDPVDANIAIATTHFRPVAQSGVRAWVAADGTGSQGIELMHNATFDNPNHSGPYLPSQVGPGQVLVQDNLYQSFNPKQYVSLPTCGPSGEKKVTAAVPWHGMYGPQSQSSFPGNSPVIEMNGIGDDRVFGTTTVPGDQTKYLTQSGSGGSHHSAVGDTPNYDYSGTASFIGNVDKDSGKQSGSTFVSAGEGGQAAAAAISSAAGVTLTAFDGNDAASWYGHFR